MENPTETIFLPKPLEVKLQMTVKNRQGVDLDRLLENDVSDRDRVSAKDQDHVNGGQNLENVDMEEKRAVEGSHLCTGMCLPLDLSI